MEMREEEDKEIELPSTLGYNNLPNRNSSSSKLSSSPSTLTGERSDQPPHHSLIFSDPSQTSHHHHHNHRYPLSSLPPNPLQLAQKHTPRRDPDPSFVSPVATTNITNTPRPTPQTTRIRYRECLKNHAASMGGHVTDGCGEFMPNGEEGTPESFKCAACECHRNFHRKEPENNAHHNNRNNNIHSHLQFPIPQRLISSSSFHGGVVATPQPMGFGGGPAESSSEDLNIFQPSDGGPLVSVQPPLSSSKKRFRTKFTQQQKDRMMEFAEKIGWRIQKQDEEEVHHFCSQVGVKRQVFKVWMHNSKQAMKKKQM